MAVDNRLDKLSTYIRYLILRATNQAGSGHPTSALSATEGEKQWLSTQFAA